MGIIQQPFGTTSDGTVVDLYTLINGCGMLVSIATYGGIIVTLKTPDRNGEIGDVVLGFDTLQEYIDSTHYFGAIIGRYGNRIASGKFTLGGNEYSLPLNDGRNHLHGGLQGFDKVVWKAKQLPCEINPGLELTYTSPDGDQGYPGTLSVKVTYTLTADNGLSIDYEATTDKDTILNLTNHTYFNLSGAGNIHGHELMINADYFTPVSDDCIPIGELWEVTATPMDFRTPTGIGERIREDYGQLQIGPGGFDQNWVLNTKADSSRLAGSVYDPESGRLVELYTTEPGVQFYSGNFLDNTVTGKGEAVYQKGSGLCLETQHFPDSPNKNSFPSTVLKQGDTYRSQTVYKFLVRD
ncbi:aldose epimerase family protein [Desulforhopalus sp. 52FAK]